MSDSSSDSDDGPLKRNRNRRGPNKNSRKIVMRIEFDDSDESSSGGESSNEDTIRPSGSNRLRNGRGSGKRLLLSDDGDSSSGGEITRTVIVRGRRRKAVIADEDPQIDEPNPATASASQCTPSADGEAQQKVPSDEGGFASDSSNDDLEKCPICLLSLRNQEIGKPSVCDHLFCAICIEEWAKNVRTCPIDRQPFETIVVFESFNNRRVLRDIDIAADRNTLPPLELETEENGEFDVVEPEEEHEYCQVCHLPDREEVMLLCDGCNQGYHMDCLNPPLVEIPEGYWYCDNCFQSEDEDSEEDLNLLFEDLREMGIPETRLRVREVRQPRIPRTRQSERIRASIVARTRRANTRITSNMDFTQPSSSSVAVATGPARTSTRRRQTRKRRTRRSTRRHRRTYVVEYDVDNFDQKFEIKTTKKVIRKRKSRKRSSRRGHRRKVGSTSNLRRSAATSDFLALRAAAREESTATIGSRFSLFGDPNDLEYFSDASNSSGGGDIEIGRGSGGGAAVQTSIRIHNFTSARSLSRRKGIIRDLDRPQQVDILSSIMDMQDRFHTATSHNRIGQVTIASDGSLILPENNRPPAKSNRKENSNSGKQEVPPSDINQAPMYPRGGGNSNYSTNTGGGGGGGGGGSSGGGYNNRFNNQSNYRNSTGGGGQFRNNGSAGGSSNSGGFLFNAFRRDNNNFQGDNNFQQSRLNNSTNSVQNLRGRFRQNQQQNQPRRNQNRYSGPPGLMGNNDQNQNADNPMMANSFGNDNLNQTAPPTAFGPQPLLFATPSKLPPLAPPPSFVMPDSNEDLMSEPLETPEPLPMYGPLNLSASEVNAGVSTGEQQTGDGIPTAIPPLAPPPWNQNLFRLSSDYGNDDDDDDDCPNFSVYSAESFQVARSGENVENLSMKTADTNPNEAETSATKDDERFQQEDEFEEKEEDLVQLDDDDEIPSPTGEDGNSNNNVDETADKAPESEVYEPESEVCEPESEVYEPESEVYEPESEVCEPESEVYEPEFPTTEQDGDDNDNDDENSRDNGDSKTESEAKSDEQPNVEEIEKMTDDKDSDRYTPDCNDEKTNHEDEQDEKELEKKSPEKTQNENNDDSNSRFTPDPKPTPEEKPLLNKKGVLELYDDSDLDEWNIDKPELIPMPDEPENRKAEDSSKENEKSDEGQTPEMPTKSIPDNVSEAEEGEIERSYTPCLDEKTEHDDINDESRDLDKSKSDETEKENSSRADVSTGVIDGIETEMISEEDEEILNQEQANKSASSRKDDKSKRDDSKRTKKEQFKKISKNTKERNYRDKDHRVRRRSRFRSRSRSDNKENRNRQRGRLRRKRKDIERYDVRNVIGQPRSYKDRYGRDTSRPRRTRSRSRSHSTRRIRTRSRSISPRNAERRSFTISPSPISTGRRSPPPRRISPRRQSPRRRGFSPRRSRSRKRSRSIRRNSPMIRRRSRSPLRLRSRSRSMSFGGRPNFRRNFRPMKRRSLPRSISRSPRSFSRSRSKSFSPRTRSPRMMSPRHSQSRTPIRPKNKRKRSKERKKKRMRKRETSITPSPPPKRMRTRSIDKSTSRKKKKRSKSKSPPEERWSQSPDLPEIGAMPNESSWTPPLLGSNSDNLTVILKNKAAANAKRKRDKKKKAEKRRDMNSKKDKKKRRSEHRESPSAPSKEVFASGNNILVSVSFNKDNPVAQQQTTVVTLPPTREEIISKQRSAISERQSKKQKKPKEKSQRRHKKTDVKPVAIIDLDRSPFQVIATSPRDIIVLTDSDGELNDEADKRNTNNNEMDRNDHNESDTQLNNLDKSVDMEHPDTMEDESFEMQQMGPKTPPDPPSIKFSLPGKAKQMKPRNPLHDEQEELPSEQPETEHEEEQIHSTNKIGPNTPPESGPCSPDVYDPFDPTKSPSMSPSNSPAPQAETQPEETVDKTSHITESTTVETRPTSIAQEKTINPVDLVMALINTKTAMVQEHLNMSAESSNYSNTLKSDGSENLNMSDESNKNITVLSNVLISAGKPQQRVNPMLNSSPPIGKLQAPGHSKPPQTKPTVTRQNGGTGTSSEEAALSTAINEIESPYSPGSADYEDLFEPPMDNSISLAQLSRNRKAKKAEVFDNLFGSASPADPVRMPNFGRSKPGNKTSKKTQNKAGKKDDEQNKIFDEVPNSAVDMQVKDKFLRKLNRQERVVEEVKLVLKPHYNRKRITKDDYKEILRRSVPKICHSRSGEINPTKIKNLIEAYVKKFRQRKKLGITGTGQVSSAVKCAAYLKKL